MVHDFDGIHTVDFLAETARLGRRARFDMMELFDQNMTISHDDVDFRLTMKAKTNYKASMSPEQPVVHHIVTSMPQGDCSYYLVRNQIILARMYDRRYINLRQIEKLLFASIARPGPKSFLFSLGETWYNSIRNFIWLIEKAI